MNEAAHRAEQQRSLGERICAAMEKEIEKLGLTGEIPAPIWELAQFHIRRDPALGEQSLEGVWLSEHGGKVGSVIIHHDGAFFAEYDIIRTHPTRGKWFIEAVSAWGRDAGIKTEARLLPMPED